MKKQIIAGSIAAILLLTAFFLRLLFPGAAELWPIIFLLPGIAFLILGITWQKKKFILPVSQVLFALCVAASIAEIYFKKAMDRRMTAQLKEIAAEEKFIEKNGRKLPVLVADDFGKYPGTITLNKPNLHGISKKMGKDRDGSLRTIYEAEYTLNEQGFRKVPVRTENPLQPPLLFFGDSFTFGIGVNDDEAFVSRIAEKLQVERNVYNFGLSGGSPAEFLLILQNQVIEKEGIDTKKTCSAYYLIINDHRYRILSSRARNTGNFLTARQKADIAFVYWTKTRLFYKSELFHAISAKFHKQLYIAYLKEAEKILREKYSTTLTVVVYPDCMPDMIDQLKQAGFRLLFLKDVMPDYKGYHTRRVDLKYEIPYDGHPTAKTHQLIADFLLKDVSANAQKKAE